MEIYNLKDKQSYIKEVAILTQCEWGQKCLSDEEFQLKVEKKINKIRDNFDNPKYCKLILLDDEILVGFISIFPTDGDERLDLSPWYATMLVKEEFRGKGYSRLLNSAILQEAKKNMNLAKKPPSTSTSLLLVIQEDSNIAQQHHIHSILHLYF